MRPHCGNSKNVKRVPLVTYVPTYRPCLDSLRLPIPRPKLFHPQPRPAVITPPCLHSCVAKLPVCHCVNNNYCTTKSCSNTDSCNRSNPYLCPHGFKDSEKINSESVRESRTREEEEYGGDNDLSSLPINCEENLESYQEDKGEKTPVHWSLSNTNCNTEANTLINQRTYRPTTQLEIESRENVIKAPIVSSLTNKYHMTSNTINSTVLSDSENARTDRTMNVRNSNFHIDRDIPSIQNVAPNVRKDDKQRSFQHINKYSQEHNGHNSRGTSTLSQYDKSKSININSINESLQKLNNDASNQCCLPPYIQTAQPTAVLPRKINQAENIPSIREQVQSFTPFNIPNGKEEIDSKRSTHKSKTQSHLGLNDNDDLISVDKIGETVESKQYDSLKSSESTRISNKQQQSLEINPSYNQTIRELVHNSDPMPSGSSTKGISKASCCKASKNSNQIIQDTVQDELNNYYHPQYRQNQTKSTSGHRNQSSGVPNYNTFSRLADLQGPDCCGHGIRRIDPKNMKNRKSENKFKELFQKSIGIECACSEYYESKNADKKDIRCKKNIACTHEVNSSACASVSCVLNQGPRCHCHYPPTFKQFNCVGNITGSCNCTENN